MLNKILNYVLAVALAGALAYGIKAKIVNVKISSENEDLNRAVEHYEEMIKILPYNVLAKERKEKADEEINATLSNDDFIIDGIKWL